MRTFQVFDKIRVFSLRHLVDHSVKKRFKMVLGFFIFHFDNFLSIKWGLVRVICRNLSSSCTHKETTQMEILLDRTLQSMSIYLFISTTSLVQWNKKYKHECTKKNRKYANPDVRHFSDPECKTCNFIIWPVTEPKFQTFTGGLLLQIHRQHPLVSGFFFTPCAKIPGGGLPSLAIVLGSVAFDTSEFQYLLHNLNLVYLSPA